MRKEGVTNAGYFDGQVFRVAIGYPKVRSGDRDIRCNERRRVLDGRGFTITCNYIFIDSWVVVVQRLSRIKVIIATHEGNIVIVLISPRVVVVAVSGINLL